jgi:LuxR family maltose regulon positive regulatory protein
LGEGLRVPDQLHSLMMLKAKPPSVPPGLVQRPRLDEQLSLAAHGPLTLVSAGPGAGKTLAVAAWAAGGAAPSRVAWLTLDNADNDPRTFWADLLGALAESGAVPQGSPLGEIIPASGFGSTEALQVRSRLADLPSPVVLVLDDFHEITSDTVLETFERLVEHQPAPLRLVVLTRADPVLRLHRLRVSGNLTEIRTHDLAFTEAEAAELFDLQGMHLQPDQLDVLRKRTEGWPAGLRLAAMSLDPADIEGGIARFSGSERSVADYLIGEVIDRLPREDRDFLLKTSVVENLTGDLADQLTGRGDSQQLLERLVGANAFVVAMGEKNEWFSYHPLLRELMRHRLALEQPRAVADLHRLAAQWMTAQGEPIESIRHAILAKDFDGAGQILITILPKFLTPDGPALAAVIEPLARSAIDTPSLTALLASAGRHLQRHEYEAMRRDALDARDFLDEAPAGVRVSAEVLIGLFEMAAARTAGDTGAVADLAAWVVGLLDRTSRRLVPAGRQYRVIAVNNLGGAQLWSGAFDDAEANLTAAARDALELGLPLVNVNAVGHQAVLEALAGRCRPADRRAREVAQFVERRGWSSEPQALATFLALGLVELSRHQLDPAGANIGRGLAAGAQTDRAIRLALAIAAVQLAVLRGEPDAALVADARLRAGMARTPDVAGLLVRWAAVAGAEALLLAERPAEAIDVIGQAGDDRGFATSWERVTLARARLAQGQNSVARDLIGPLLDPGWPIREPAIMARLIQALIAERDHRDTAALTAVTAAIELAAPESIRRPFLAVGGRLIELLQRYQRLSSEQSVFVADLLDKLNPLREQPAVAALMVEHLTERELIVLHYLPTMLKAGEIASDLYVSVNTVKAHLRSMYRKLGVSNRREAVERARTVGLLR